MGCTKDVLARMLDDLVHAAYNAGESREMLEGDGFFAVEVARLKKEALEHAEQGCQQLPHLCA